MRVVDLTAEQWEIINELRKELRGEKEIGTTNAEAFHLLLAIATEIHSIHDKIKVLKEVVDAIPI